MNRKIGVMGTHYKYINRNTDKEYEWGRGERTQGLPLGYRVWQVIVSAERY